MIKTRKGLKIPKVNNITISVIVLLMYLYVLNCLLSILCDRSSPRLALNVNGRIMFTMDVLLIHVDGGKLSNASFKAGMSIPDTV